MGVFPTIDESGLDKGCFPHARGGVSRNGAVKGRSQTHNPKTDCYVKRDTRTGKFVDVKQDGMPFKGVRKEK